MASSLDLCSAAVNVIIGAWGTTMSPFSLSHILDQVVRDQAGRMALEGRQQGRASDIPESYYMERIADRAGVTKRQLYRWVSGETSPSTAMLLRLCEICETTLPVEWLCREVGLHYSRTGKVRLDGRELVLLVSRELQDASAVAKDVLQAMEDGIISLEEAGLIEAEIDRAIDDLTSVKQIVAASAMDPTRPTDGVGQGQRSDDRQLHRSTAPRPGQPVSRLRTA